MKTYVALLRGINVGGHRKIAMNELKDAFERLGFSDVSTYINSGNVIFKTDMDDIRHLRTMIERALNEIFGFELQLILRDRETISNLAHGLPKEWENDDKQKTDVLFLTDDYDRKETIDLIKHQCDIDTLIYIDGAIIWHIERVNYSKSGMRKFIGTSVYKNMSARNINTVRKLAQILEDDVRNL